MKNLTLSFLFLISTSLFAQNIIPKPVSLAWQSGSFQVNPQTSIVIPDNAADVAEIAENLRLRILITTGFSLEVKNQNAKNAIIFELDKNLAEEAYELAVKPSQIIIKAATAKGFFYAYQTMLQLADENIFSSSKQNNWNLSFKACQIKDAPRFAYRGLMLDVGRHMMPVSFIKKYIDLMALYKFNQFHWHLTEDQGWRIEIKKYPKLTQVGAWRKETPAGHNSENRGDGTPYGGFYTQDEVREIVAYAAKKYINVIPEIEMPGHAVAALASYPELGCSGGPYQVRTRWGIAKEVFCPYEQTFTFLEDVLTEVMDLFPSPYIHIGGDECPKDSWKSSDFCQQLIKNNNLKDEHGLQSYFITRIDNFVSSKGRKIIGWDEILEGGLSPNATVMSWRGTEGGIEAARQKHDVIMSPNSFHYLDYYQGDPATEPLAIGGFLPLDKVYAYEPFAENLTDEQKSYIKGVQANLWTEYVKTPAVAEYMTYPRALAVAETGWSAQGSKNYPEFEKRVIAHFDILKQLGVNHSAALFNLKADIKSVENGQIKVFLSNGESQPKIKYTIDGTAPNAGSLSYTPAGIVINKNTQIRAALFDDKNQTYGNAFKTEIRINKATGKTYEYRSPKSRYNGGGNNGLTDGKIGANANLNTWVGIDKGDLDMTIDLGQPLQIEKVAAGFLHSPDSWILFPKNLKISVSIDGKTFTEVSQKTFDKTAKTSQTNERVMLNFATQKARYIKVEAQNNGVLPTDHPGAGTKSWLFVDEIEVY